MSAPSSVFTRPCSPPNAPRQVPLPHLCLPHALDSLGDADVIRLELVQANAYDDGGGIQPPPEQPAQTGVSPLGDVVDDDGLEANVGVDEDGRAQDRVHGGVERARRKGGNGQRHQARGQEALKRPVVRAVGGRGGRNGSRVVDWKVLADVENGASTCAERGWVSNSGSVFVPPPWISSIR